MELGKILGISRRETGLRLKCEAGELRAEFLGDGVVKVRAGKRLAEERSWSVVKRRLGRVRVWLRENAEKLNVGEKEIELVISKADSRMEFWAGGKKFFGNLRGMELDEKRFSILNEMPADERYFGFGEKAKNFDKRGSRLVMRNRDPLTFNRGTDPLYLSVPFFLAVRRGLAYGFFLDTAYESHFDMRDEEKGFRIGAGGIGFSEVTYYVIYGPKPADVLRKYTQLTGRSPLPPLWALGYHQSRFAYKSEAGLMRVVREFRRRRIPCDAIHLDIDYMDGYRCFTWHPRRFPDPERMTRELAEMGMRVVTIIDPGIKADERFWVYREGIERDSFAKRVNGKIFVGYVWPGKCAFPDFTKPEVRRWWASLHENLLAKGVAGIWNDMNEPACKNLTPNLRSGFNLLRWILPLGTGDVGFRDIPFDGVRNAYALLHAMGTAEAFDRFARGKRPFILSRSGFAGIQRYAAIWTADNLSTWDHLRLSVEMLLNLGLSGIAFVGADIGGFTVLAPRKPFLARCSPELYARWIQLGIFYPFCRTHSTKPGRPHEPWRFGRRVEEIARKHIQLRYRLLPYLYSLFWEHVQNGMPIMRALFLHYPEDESCYRGDEFLFGPFMLIAPVSKKGARRREVYLPAGKWYDYWTGKAYGGKRAVTVDAPLDKIPIFVKAGAMIPTWPSMNFVGEKRIREVTLEVYPGDGGFTWYEGDGESVDPDFALRRVTCGLRGRELKVEIHRREGKYRVGKRELTILAKWVKKPSRVEVDGKRADYRESADGVEVRIEEDGKGHTIELRL